MFNIINFDTFDDLLRDAEKRIIDLALKSIADKGWFSLALSGGSTPAPLYSRLAESNLPWSKIHLFWGDERIVPLDSELSNYNMVKENLLSKISIPEKNVHIPTVDLPPTAVAEYYESEIARHSTFDFKVFDLILLGIGPDGHTASLFPESKALDEKNKLVVAVPPPTNVQPSVPRITFTFPLINNAREILFLATGEGKKELFTSEEKYPFMSVKNATIFFTEKK